MEAQTGKGEGLLRLVQIKRKEDRKGGGRRFIALPTMRADGGKVRRKSEAEPSVSSHLPFLPYWLWSFHASTGYTSMQHLANIDEIHLNERQQ